MEDNAGFVELTREQAAMRYGVDTGAASRRFAGAFLVNRADAVATIVQRANRSGFKLWPISGGRNFGYGTSLPVEHDCHVLDLTQLKGIRFSAETHSVTIEPGVTQGDLATFLDEHNLPYLVPTTGLGPNGSLLGNALDGGYGLTPIMDHFDAISDIEGLWGNGEPFSHSFADMGCESMARGWRPGLGPSFQSLLRQGNLGIVTRATIQLARAPEASRVLVMEWRSEADFIAAQAEFSRLVEEIPGIGGIISMNAPRILSTHADAPLGDTRQGEERERYLAQLAGERQIAAWTSVGTLYGSSKLVSGAVKDLRRRLPMARVWAFSVPQIRRIAQLAKLMPSNWFPAIRRNIGALVNTAGTIEGRPIVAFLRMAYALDRSGPVMSAERHPAKDGQGILWFAPLVPMHADGLASYVKWTSRVLQDYGFDPLLAVTTRSPRVHSGTIPLLFRKNDAEHAARAKACYRALVREGIRQGMPPYRIGIDFMDEIHANSDSAYGVTLARIKGVLDPHGVVAPGRYITGRIEQRQVA
ncbi:FAD-binding protein [Lysobacter fragariae]